MRRPDHRKERGATLVLVAISITALLLIVALVIDLGVTRSERRDGQLAVDNATASAAQTLASTGDRTEACEAAFDYLRLTLDSANFTGDDCAALASSCSTTDAPIRRTAGADLTAWFFHPVQDGAQIGGISLMDQTSTIGAAGGLGTAGTACDRVGVWLTTTGDSFFGGVAGANGRSTAVHAVAPLKPGGPPGRLLNLAVLERTDCAALTKDGSGAGGIAVGRVPNLTAGFDAGSIVIDSDGSGPTCSSEVGAIDVNGFDSVIRADGPAGCDAELTLGETGHDPLQPAGQGCGVIETYASGPPGCAIPACTSSGVLVPSPVRATERITRAPVDHLWNCKSSYPAALDIDGCTGTSLRRPYIDDLKAAVGASGPVDGFQRWTEEIDPDCDPLDPSGTPVTLSGNWHVDCASLDVKRALTFTDGNVVFDGDVTLESSGSLSINTANPDALSWLNTLSPLDPEESSSGAAFVFFRDGTLTKQGTASLDLSSVAVYMSEASKVVLAGGAGSLSWTSPTTGPFESLALWSEGTDTHEMAGQAGLTLLGTYFMPAAVVDYSGNGENNAVDAQFVARKLQVRGNGILTLKPTAGVRVESSSSTVTLIR